jgi:bla regulator protein BlaR1
MREDREICCDSLTLSVLSEDEVTNYGFTIIKLAEVSLRAPYLPAVAGIINKKSKIKRRIILIKLFKKNSYRITASALAVLLIAGIIFLTGETKAKIDTNGGTETIADTNKEKNAKADTNEETNTITDIYEETNTKADTIGETSTQIIDGVDCTFVDDQDAIGKWETVDFVKDIDDFVPNVISWPEDLYLLSIKLLPNGQMPKIDADSSDEIVPCSTWTKGYIINHYEKTAGKYTIKEIDGTSYMFWEWKNGDYVRSGTKPYYYVLNKVWKG